jgi:thiol-disulfide isomerase/thioredoxin
MRGAALLVAVGLALAMGEPAFAQAKKGALAADFALQGPGGEVKLSALRGKVVLLDFWADWCAPCKKELPVLDALAKKYKGKDLVILAVNIDKKRENAERFLKAAGISALRIAFDPDGAVVGKYEPPTMPSSYLIDRNGKVTAINSGFTPGDEKTIAAQIDAALK